jgi:hypothetical protein
MFKKMHCLSFYLLILFNLIVALAYLNSLAVLNVMYYSQLVIYHLIESPIKRSN